MSSFNTIFENYKEKFTYKHGHNKVQKIKSKVLSSSNLKKLSQISIDRRIAPSEADFGSGIHTITYFMFAGGETTAMAELFAIHNWNETVNRTYRLCSDLDLCHKAEATFRRYQIPMSH
ncbi:hypothetical protein [Echinicola sp. 20G]|uniref:hypothetical protein n=1 Tax=Echinicola sp. 20G TaxID=2781961 RepID=UPI0019108317|nr:hypothetical protein [Echinicola sp. 20G]